MASEGVLIPATEADSAGTRMEEVTEEVTGVHTEEEADEVSCLLWCVARMRMRRRSANMEIDDRGGRGRGRGGHGGHGHGGDSRPPPPESSNARMRKMVVKFADEEVGCIYPTERGLLCIQLREGYESF